MPTPDFFQDSASSLSFDPMETDKSYPDSKNFLLLLPGSHPTHSSTPPPNESASPLIRRTSLCRPQARRLPFSLSFTPVSEPDPPVQSPNRCRLLGFTPLAEKTSSPVESSDQSFCGQPTPRAKECAPCALFFTRADVFVSTEMVSQGLLAPSHDHYSPLQISLSQPQFDPIYAENYFDQENGLEDESRSATSSSAHSALRFWDGPATSATSTRASSPVSSLDFHCPTLALTSMPIPMPMTTKKKGMRRARSLLGNSLENEPDDCWADDEGEEINFQQSTGSFTRRMSEPSGGKPKMSKVLEL